MIDYRWLQVALRGDTGLRHPTAIPVPGTGFVLVLQIREEEGPRGETWWGEWHDVPIVPESADNSST